MFEGPPGEREKLEQLRESCRIPDMLVIDGSAGITAPQLAPFIRALARARRAGRSPMTAHPIDPVSRKPYPGLRPFREDESDLFFGRDRQIDELLGRLQRHRFIAVTGPSGCGKSSLIKAGSFRRCSPA